MKKNLLAFLALAMTAAAAPAMAQAVFPPPEPAPLRSTPYVGASVGLSKAKAGCPGFIRFVDSCDDTDFTWGFLAGYQVNRYFAAEAEYRDLGYVTGHTRGTSGSIHATAWDAALIGFVPIWSRLTPYGKFGGYRALLSESGATPSFADEHKSGWTYGAGLQWDFSGRASLRFQWQRYRQVNGSATTFGSNDYDTLTGVLIWRLR
jgi:opacity protein-like surface antigen